MIFTVTDVKEMGYCPRMVYYRYCMPALAVEPTVKMRAGVEAGQAVEELEHRRSLRAYGLQEGQREYDVWLESEALGLRGRVDMVIVAPGGGGAAEAIPVDYKNSDGPDAPAGRGRAKAKRKKGGPPAVGDAAVGDAAVGDGWDLQLAAYGLMLEEMRGARVERGFIYLIPLRAAREVPLTPELKEAVRGQVERMRDMVAGERMAEPPENRAKCAACEYRRFCNDG
jgi:CRISPR-associated exonuclease Cas4